MTEATEPVVEGDGEIVPDPPEAPFVERWAWYTWMTRRDEGNLGYPYTTEAEARRFKPRAGSAYLVCLTVPFPVEE